MPDNDETKDETVDRPIGEFNNSASDGGNDFSEPQIRAEDYAAEAAEREAREAHRQEIENSIDPEADPGSEVEVGLVPGADGESDPDLPGAPELELVDGSDADSEQLAAAESTGDDDDSDEMREQTTRRVMRPVKDLPPRHVTLVVNEEPGEECRIAVLANGRLDSYFSEREASATNVGSIYKARVMNVEAAIQAAFVDFGSGQNGFLHISDLHPKYFPGESRTEQVGKKIARSDRPLIQNALKKGQEILVQVIKEGLGSKGPTLTSYLSLPGRLLVMMPDMDRVGVSRRVDDEEQRREMRKILDSLNLPDGFGFILRTAGFDSGKTELQRDAAYLQRLWDAMAARSAKTGAPCELYTESDVLVRTLRDHTDSSVEAIIVDSPGAFERAKLFLEVIAPNTAAKVLYYNGRAPVFEAYGIERQIDEIHARSVPLPSGGALVFDQTEALVAIDVNSGRSRAARDSETNAFQTNCEAIDELCRQLRLRDLGGLIVVDCIDMRFARHRREVEDRLASLLKLDRAKASFAPISEFGIIEMTRQRMRPSLRKMHYADCPHCSGAGEVKLADTVAADAMRRIALLFCHQEVARVEIVCSVRVAGELMSKRRRSLHEMEDRTGKRVDVRISEAFAADRVEMYAYDDRNADLELDHLSRLPKPGPSVLHDELPEEDEAELTPQEQLARKRRRRRRPAPADATAIAMAGGFDNLPAVLSGEQTVRSAMSAASSAAGPDNEKPEGRGRGRGRDRDRRGRGRKESARSGKSADTTAGSEVAPTTPPQGRESGDDSREGRGSGHGRRGRRRGRGRRSFESIGDLVADHSAFETAMVAEVLGQEPESLLAALREKVDPEMAALLRPGTLMLPPELIRVCADHFAPQGEQVESTQPDHSEAGNEAGEDARPPEEDRNQKTEGRAPRRRRGGRGRRRQGGDGRNEDAGQHHSAPRGNNAPPAPSHSPAEAPRARPSEAPPAPAPTAESAPAKPKRRSLYGAAVRLLGVVERSRAKGRSE